MKHEEKLRILLEKSKILNIIAHHKALWENCSFVINIVINLIIIFSYSINVMPSGVIERDPNDDSLIVLN